MAREKAANLENPEADMSIIKRRFWMDKDDTRRGDLLLLPCCFVTGMQTGSSLSTFSNISI